MKPTSGSCLKAIAALACSIAVGAAGQANASSQTVPVLKLEQVHQQVGKFTVYAAKDRVRADSRDLGYSILSQAPDWKVFIFSTKSKTICSTTLEHWRHRNNLQSALLPAVESPLPVVKWMPVQQDGLSCSKGIVNERKSFYDPFTLMSAANLKAATKQLTEVAVKSSTYIICSPPGQQEVARVVNSLFGVRDNESLPISLNFDMGNRIVHKLTTTSWTRTAVPASLFVVPNGFKRMSRIDQVILSNHGSAKDMDEMFGDLGVGKGFGTDK